MLSGQKKNPKFILNEFIQHMNDLDPGNKYTYLHIMNGSSVCNKSWKIIKVQCPRMT